ncbi:MAG: uroporphyrinogen-III synthase [Candidatus Latescibacterota bacterium]|nr:MAG: uroporphyrinogen-III synthase [Candidatus Latescibacterota bacterium]
MKSKRIVITRAEHQAGKLAALIEERGGVPLMYPCIAVKPVEDTRELDRSLRSAANGEFDWIVFTSANTVRAVFERLGDLGVEPASIAKARIAGVGPGTAEEIESLLGLDVALVPDQHEAEGLVKSFSPASGLRIFLPQSDLARPVLAEGLRLAGAVVRVVPAYRTILGSGGVDVPLLLFRDEIDAVTFTSSSTVDNFMRRLAKEGGDPESLRNVCIACLGRKTARTAETHNLSVTVTAPENTVESLVAALVSYFGRPTG